jgi:hypothetical protein
MTLKQLLESKAACLEAIEWVGDRDLQTAWAECERGDWMFWLCGKMEGETDWPNRQQIVIAVCDCAELSLPIFEKKFPKDNRPRLAIETARKWANGIGTTEDVKKVADAAQDAAYAVNASVYGANAGVDAAYTANAAADTAYAASAAYAAANAAANAAYAAYAASAAAYAANAYAAYAANAAADTAVLKQCADICRAKLSIPQRLYLITPKEM